MFQHNPKILAGAFALIVGIFTKNIIATITSGLAVLYLLNNF
jgi:branched-subunit amino acid transport protein